MGGIDPCAQAPDGQQRQRPGRPQIPGQVAQRAAHIVPGRPGKGRQVPGLPVADPVLAAFAGRNPPGQDQRQCHQRGPRQPALALPQLAAGVESQQGADHDGRRAHPATGQEAGRQGDSQRGGAGHRAVDAARQRIEGQRLARHDGGHDSGLVGAMRP
ncbi:hypothetical protein G6F22_019042 [Rhizopus arrhizus]|nr:hypothetical protein G6F22_019042 [Rhizopus arrhizus]